MKSSGQRSFSFVNVIVRNYHGVNLPETGSVTAIVLTISGVITILGGALVMRKKND